jgi:two-component system cell cycle sensor histidine kinase/response regulator CckA
MLRDALQEILESLGYTVHVAGDAQQARTFLADFQGKLDLLVTDVIMPGDSGPKLAAELVKTRADLRVIYISGYTADELVSHGLAHPGALLLEKPFTREQIGRRIREVLA